jgi:hypothetical protein
MHKYIASLAISAFVGCAALFAAPAAEAQTPCRQGNDYYTNPAVYEACMRSHNRTTRGDFGRRERGSDYYGESESFNCRGRREDCERAFRDARNRRIDWQAGVNQLDRSAGRDPRSRPFDLRHGRNGCEPVLRRGVRNEQRAMQAGYNACRHLTRIAYGGRGEGGGFNGRRRSNGGGFADANDARECRLAREIGGAIGEALQGDRCNRGRRRR